MQRTPKWTDGDGDGEGDTCVVVPRLALRFRRTDERRNGRAREWVKRALQSERARKKKKEAEKEEDIVGVVHGGTATSVLGMAGRRQLGNEADEGGPRIE